MRRLEWMLLIALAFCFAPALVEMARVWSSADSYSHGFLIPIVSAWLAWRLAPTAARLERRTDLRAVPLLGAALALYAVSLAGGWVSGQGLALVATLVSLVWLLRGRAWLRCFAFPLGYLLFMVPLPPSWIGPLVVRLQLFVSEGAVAAIQALGVPVTRVGNVLELPGGDALFVAEACSGLTSVVTLTPLAVVLAYLTALSPLRTAILALSVIPVAMLTNLLRVGATVLAAYAWGTPAVTREPLHSVAGLAVYVVACAAMIGLWRLLSGPAPVGEVRAAAS